jgi:hypothetical protein
MREVASLDFAELGTEGGKSLSGGVVSTKA